MVRNRSELSFFLQGFERFRPSWMQNHWRLGCCVGSETLAGDLCRQGMASRAVASRIANRLGARQLNLVDACIAGAYDAEWSTFPA